MTSFCIVGKARERIEVQVIAYERSPVGEYFDDNWLLVQVSVCIGAFSGKYDATFLTDELVSFCEQLEALYRTLIGTAKFSTMEEQLSLLFRGNGLGEIFLKGTATDMLGTGNTLMFELSLDQTYLHTTLMQLNNVIKLFPVRAG